MMSTLIDTLKEALFVLVAPTWRIMLQWSSTTRGSSTSEGRGARAAAPSECQKDLHPSPVTPPGLMVAAIGNAKLSGGRTPHTSQMGSNSQNQKICRVSRPRLLESNVQQLGGK